MAYYEHLAVYKSSYDFMIEIYKIVSNFPKEYKYSVWEKMKNHSLEIIIDIFELNSIREKNKRKEKVFYLISLVEKLKILIRLSKDLKILSLKQFSSLSEKNINILKQLEWWKNSIN